MAGFEINLLCPGGSVTFSRGNKGVGRGKSMILNKITFVLIFECFHERFVNSIFNQVLSMTVDPLAIEA